jgi:hypothetical protein
VIISTVQLPMTSQTTLRLTLRPPASTDIRGQGRRRRPDVYPPTAAQVVYMAFCAPALPASHRPSAVHTNHQDPLPPECRVIRE